MRRATKKQIDVLIYLSNFIHKNGYPPTVRDVVRAFRFNSTNSARGYLNGLDEKGYIKITPFISRGIRIMERGYKVLE
jgi:repressor LexA